MSHLIFFCAYLQCALLGGEGKGGREGDRGRARKEGGGSRKEFGREEQEWIGGFEEILHRSVGFA